MLFTSSTQNGEVCIFCLVQVFWRETKVKSVLVHIMCPQIKVKGINQNKPDIVSKLNSL